jgi:hypothetical protein
MPPIQLFHLRDWAVSMISNALRLRKYLAIVQANQQRYQGDWVASSPNDASVASSMTKETASMDGRGNLSGISVDEVAEALTAPIEVAFLPPSLHLSFPLFNTGTTITQMALPR